VSTRRHAHGSLFNRDLFVFVCEIKNQRMSIAHWPHDESKRSNTKQASVNDESLYTLNHHQDLDESYRWSSPQPKMSPFQFTPPSQCPPHFVQFQSPTPKQPHMGPASASLLPPNYFDSSPKSLSDFEYMLYTGSPSYPTNGSQQLRWSD
jgi:hypothetical protein